MARILDTIDHAILRALQMNARQSNKELAAQVGLAPSSCLERVRRLKEEGILRGFHADVEPKALGIGLEAVIIIRLRYHSKETLEELWRHLMAQPEVRHAYYLAGADDLLVHVAVKNTEHLRNFGLDVICTRPEVGDFQTNLVYDYETRHPLPIYEDA